MLCDSVQFHLGHPLIWPEHFSCPQRNRCNKKITVSIECQLKHPWRKRSVAKEWILQWRFCWTLIAWNANDEIFHRWSVRWLWLNPCLLLINLIRRFVSPSFVDWLFHLTSDEKFDRFDLSVRCYSVQFSFVRSSLKTFDERLSHLMSLNRRIPIPIRLFRLSFSSFDYVFSLCLWIGMMNKKKFLFTIRSNRQGIRCALSRQE